MNTVTKITKTAKSIQTANITNKVAKGSLSLPRRSKRLSLLCCSNESYKQNTTQCFSLLTAFDSKGKGKSSSFSRHRHNTLFSAISAAGSSKSSKKLDEIKEKSDNISMSKYIVGHDEKKKYFYIKLQADASKSFHLAKLEYVYIRPGVVDLWHTEVPPEFQGHGIAKYLAKAAFDHFCEKEIRTRPTCTYLQKYLKDFPTARYLDNIDKTPT